MKVQQTKYDRRSVFDADIIYVLTVDIVRSSNLYTGSGAFVQTQCGNKVFKSKTRSYAEWETKWNESTKFHFPHQPKRLSFAVIREEDDYEIGVFHMVVEPTYFEPNNPGILCYIIGFLCSGVSLYNRIPWNRAFEEI